MNLLEIAAAAGVNGFLHCNEFHKLIELAVGKDVLEIGSFKGLSAYGMAWTAKRVVCLDTFKANSAGQFQLEDITTLEEFKVNTSRFQNVAHVVATSADAVLLIHGDFDMIFLDAMHTYEDVKADIERWWPRVRQDGTMVFHDYGHADFPGVKRAVDERFGSAAEGTTLVTLRWIERNMVA